MLKLICAAAVIAMAAFAMPACAENAATVAPPMIDTPKVLAGDYVDTSSVQSMVHDLFKSDRVKGLTEEQKILNFYHWYRRVVYPYRYMGGDRRDLLKAINTAGFSLCGSQAAVVMVVLREAGYPCRPANIGLGPEWGHTVWEVKYDEKWHLFDAMSAFYVMTRDNPPHVASADEVEADPTLVTKAVEEKRCGPEYVYTARNHEITLAEREEFITANHATDVPWSLLCTKPGPLTEFWNQAATRKKISVGKDGDTLGGKCTPNVLDIKLKGNERYVRQWEGSGLWMKQPSFPNTPPQNMAAGDNEKFDTVNFKYFEPYRHVDPKNPWNVAVYRSYGNGYLEWTPATAAQLAQGATMENLTELPSADRRQFPLFKPADAAKPATIVLPVKSPYAVVQVEVELAMTPPKDGAASLTLTPIADGKRGAIKKLWNSTADGNPAKVTVSGDTTTITADLTDVTGMYEYELKLILPAGSAVGLKRLKTTFQLNPMALPGLVPGENKIRVSAATPTKLSGGKLVVSYNWFDAPQWVAASSNVKELTELPAEYVIELPKGEKLPKMKSLELYLKAD